MDKALERDGLTGIMYKRWVSPSPKAILLLVHGLGGHSSRWDFLADFFLKNNISSYAIELKGFGQTEGLKGDIDSFATYFNDIQSLGDVIKREQSGKKIFLIGESMGGLIAFSLAGLKPELFDGLILISTAFKSKLKFSAGKYLLIFASMIFNPRKQFIMPFNSRMCTRDLAYQKAMDTNEDEHRYATARLLFNTLFAQMRAGSLKNRISTPTLFLVAGDNDALTDSQEQKVVFKGLKNQDKEIIQYPQMCHALPIELGREKVFSDILNWIGKII